jgi:hypothetical protein
VVFEPEQSLEEVVGMVSRKKENSIAQVNLRITPQLQRQLAAAAIANGNTFSREVRQRLVGSLVEAKLMSLAAYIAAFESLARDITERNARKDPRASPGIEATFRLNADLHTTFAHLYTSVEQVLRPCMHDPELRELVRGPQQQRGKGGKS